MRIVFQSRLPAATFFSFLVLFAMGSIQEARANQNRFAKQVGSFRVGPVKSTAPLQVPYILWGGDMATFHGNGGLLTKGGSVFAKQGLALKLTDGNDFAGQVRDYMSGRSPFLRGTFRMLGMAAEVLNSDPRTKPVIFMQMTWSAGDHLVSRGGLKTIQALRGKTIALQRGGPHVGMLDDVLRTAGLGWEDVNIVWVDDITGPKGPAAAFKAKRQIDACFVVTPDLIALTGGLKSVGTGAEGTVKGARALDSTAYRSYTIADVYAVRSDFLRSNRDLVEKFAAGYLRSVEEVIDLRRSKSSRYNQVLDYALKIYGRDLLPNRDEADGLLADCTFVGHPGNIAFFNDARNPHGFSVFREKALEMAVKLGFSRRKTQLLASDIDWNSRAFVGYLKKVGSQKGERFRAEVVQSELESLNSQGGLDDSTIYTFTVGFEPNQDSFPASRYGKDFKRVIELAQEYGGAVIAVRGHSDPTKVLAGVVRAGLNKGVIQRRGARGNFSYSVRGRPLDLNSTSEVIKLIRSGALDGGGAIESPREIMQAALNLSLRRAEAVRKEIVDYARKRRLKLDASQIQAQGVGIREPFIATPRSMADVRKNTRVEFRLVGVSPEAMAPSDFDY